MREIILGNRSVIYSPDQQVAVVSFLTNHPTWEEEEEGAEGKGTEQVSGWSMFSYGIDMVVGGLAEVD